MSASFLARAIAPFLIPALALAQSPAPTPDPEDLAGRIVSDSARVAEGDIVLIRGHQRDAAFLEALAIRARAAGAFPLLSYTSDHLTRGLVDDVPDKFDSQLNALDMRLIPLLSAIINVEAADNPTLLNHVPPARLAARAKADGAAADLYRRAGVRQVSIGGGLYPTAAAANQYAMAQDELARAFWTAMAADTDGLEATGAMVKMVLASGGEAQITNPNGTDLKLKIKDRPAVVGNGVISDEELKAGGAPLQVQLPAGEVLLAPASGDGKVVVDTLVYRGREISGLTVVFKAGRVVNMYARSGIDALKPLYDAAGPGKDVLSTLSLGINPEIRLPAGVKPNAACPMGMVTIGIGNNTRAGGDDTCPFALLLYLPGSTLTVDGAALVDAGKLVMPAEDEEVGVVGPPAP